MTKPLSQKTGMETIQPISSTASSGFFWPTMRTTRSASLRAAPVFSRIVPISAPRMMTMPMEVKVPEKPEPITSAILVSGMPASSARMSEMPMIARNGWTLYLLIATIMMTMASRNTMMRARPDINESLLL